MLPPTRLMTTSPPPRNGTMVGVCMPAVRAMLDDRDVVDAADERGAVLERLALARGDQILGAS